MLTISYLPELPGIRFACGDLAYITQHIPRNIKLNRQFFKCLAQIGWPIEALIALREAWPQIHYELNRRHDFSQRKPPLQGVCFVAPEEMDCQTLDMKEPSDANAD